MSSYSSRPSTTHFNSSSSSSSRGSSASSSSSSYSSSPHRASSDKARTPSVEIMRCSRCAKSVETISRSGSSRISSDDASASGMVRFGHNLYYCDRCAKMVGYT